MTEHSMNIDSNELNDAARIRAYADEELPRDEAGTAADDQQRVAFELALRDRVAHVMDEGVTAPQSLRDSVAAMFAAEATSEDAAPQQTVSTPMGDTTERSFWSGAAGRFLAVAAVLILVATLAIVSVSTLSGPAVPNAPFEIQRASDVQSFVPRAHNNSTGCSKEQFDAKFTHATIDDAVLHIDDYLDGVPEQFREKLVRLESAGFVFAGMGKCGVPGGGDSVHAYYRPASGEGQPISIFIQEATTEELAGMCDRHCFTAQCDDKPDAGQTLVVWQCSGFLHYLYSSDAGVVATAREAFMAPTRSAPFMPGLASR